MATLLAHIRVRPGMEARFEEIALELYRASHANERDVRRYEYWRGADPGTYYTLESFDTDLGFLAHQTSDHHESAGPAIRDVVEDLRLEWVDPVQGAAPLAPTNRTQVPPDASELQKLYFDRYPVTVQDWWLPLR